MLTLTRHAEPGEHWDAELAMTHELRCKTRLRTRSADGEECFTILYLYIKESCLLILSS